MALNGHALSFSHENTLLVHSVRRERMSLLRGNGGVVFNRLRRDTFLDPSKVA